MSLLTTFEEKQWYPNYSGSLDISKFDLYVPIILNKRYIYICDDPFKTRFAAPLITRTTRVMCQVHRALADNKTQWRTPRRMRYLK